MSALRAAVAQPMAARIDARERLIVALDVPDTKRANSIASELRGVVGMFKLGPWLSLVEGFEALLTRLVSQGERVFLDSKGCDIPETMRGGVSAASKRGIKFLTIHGNGEVSDAAMSAAVGGREGSLKIFSVTVLTSLDQSDLTGVGYGTLNDEVRKRAEKAMRCGCDGFIASAHETRMIKSLARQRGIPDFMVINPGIRPVGTDSGDHKRASTPSHAVTEGADYLVVGRPIIHATNPIRAAKAIVDEMQEAFDRRSDA